MFRRLAALLMGTLLVTACSPMTPPTDRTSLRTSDSSPAPTYWCSDPATPGATSDPPYQCSSDAYRTEQERRALEAEALAVYEKFFDEYRSLQSQGGTPEHTAVLLEPTENGFQLAMMALLKDMFAKGQTVRGEPMSTRFAINRQDSFEDSEVTVTACHDTRAAALYDKDGKKIGDGQLTEYIMFLHRTDGRLRIFSNERTVGSCSLGP